MEALKEKTAHGFLWSFIENMGIKVFSASTYFLLATLLKPGDFGLVALANSMISFTSLFAGMGLVAAIIQHPDLKETHLNSSFWGNIVVGILLFLLIYLSAPFIASIYKEPELVNILRVSAIVFIIASMGSVHQGLLEKELKINIVAKARIISILISGAVGIIMAYMNYRVWCLVVQQLLYISIQNIIFWSRSDWSPAFYFRWQYYKSLMVFSYKSTVANVIYNINNYSADLIIGLFLGKNVLGYFSFANKVYATISMTVLDTTGRVAYPLFSKYTKNVKELTNIFLKTSRLCSYLSFPIFGLAIVVIPIVINLYAGKWNNTIMVIQLLCASAFLRIPQFFFNFYLISLRKQRLDIIQTSINTAIGVVLIFTFTKYGLNAVASSVIIKNFIYLCFFLVLLQKRFEINMLSYIQMFFKPFLSTLVSAGVALLIFTLKASLGEAAYILGVLVGGGVYFMLVHYFAPDVTKQLKSFITSIAYKSS